MWTSKKNVKITRRTYIRGIMAAAYCTHSYKSAIFSGFASFSSSSNRYDSKWFSSFTVSISELSSHYNNAHNMKNRQLAEKKPDKKYVTRIFFVDQMTKPTHKGDNNISETKCWSAVLRAFEMRASTPPSACPCREICNQLNR